MAIYGSRIASVILLVAAQAVVAAERTDLLPRVRKGDLFALEGSAKSHRVSAMLASRGELGDLEGDEEETLKATLEVLAAEGGNPTSLKIAFDERECRIKRRNAVGPGGPWKEIIPPAAGKTVVVNVGAGDSLWFDKRVSRDPEASAIALASVTWFFPTQAVGVGDEWGPDTARLSRALYTLREPHSVMRCKLDRIEEAETGNPKAAHISFTGACSDGGSWLRESISLRGMAVVEMPLGRIQVSLDGKIRISGVAERASRTPARPWKGPVKAAKEKDYLVEGTGTLEMRASLTFLRNVAGGGGTPGVAAPPREPAAPAAAGPDQFVGTFEDARLTVHIQKGAGGGLTGTLRTGGRQFPFTARLAGNSIEGTFESEGNRLTFTAALQGDTLTLTSGSTTYQLRRRPANPLDDEPDPGNPLDPAQPVR